MSDSGGTPLSVTQLEDLLSEMRTLREQRRFKGARSEAEWLASRLGGSGAAPAAQSWLPDTFIERTYCMALWLEEFKLSGDTVVGLSALEASAIRNHVSRSTEGHTP